jgi:glycerol-3-phosphate acyltransferase PlsY
MLLILIAITASYLIGSIPTAYIFCRLLKGIDIRTVGSGNVGATNALRVLGKRWGILVLLLDILKGFLPVFFLGNFLQPSITALSNEQLRFIIGLGCISGHNWTLFLRFRGGKGVATTIGVLIGLAFSIPELNIVLGFLSLTWFLTFVFTRIVSISSIIAAISLPVLAAFLRQSAFIVFASIVLALFVVVRHKTNIARLLQGKEPRLKFKK